ncbi:MAG: regulatory protein GemA [Gammaproteobacteria bacterium]|nr:regulatory protein GemA [Gammaproteobacteria bacterium]
MPRADIRTAELGAIHIAKKQLGLDDDTYRTMLFTLTAKRSAADLDAGQRRKVLEHLQSRGFKNVKRAAHRAATDPLAGKIRALWLEMAASGVVRDGSERALGVFIERQTGVRAVGWLSDEQSRKVIESLKAWKARTRHGAPTV